MVEGTPTTAKPSFASAWEPVCEPLPPMTTSASIPFLLRLERAFERPSGCVNFGERALPSMVPPCCTMPPTSRAASGRRGAGTRPRLAPAEPLCTPNPPPPLASAPRVTARTAAFIPGASPPLVRTASRRVTASSLLEILVEHLGEALRIQETLAPHVVELFCRLGLHD